MQTHTRARKYFSRVSFFEIRTRLVFRLHIFTMRKSSGRNLGGALKFHGPRTRSQTSYKFHGVSARILFYSASDRATRRTSRVRATLVKVPSRFNGRTERFAGDSVGSASIRFSNYTRTKGSAEIRWAYCAELIIRNLCELDQAIRKRSAEGRKRDKTKPDETTRECADGVGG